VNIAICDDKASDRDEIRAILESYMEANGYAGGIRAFASGEELLASFSTGLYDVIFLDIYMGGADGIETARRIRVVDPTCAIVFITSSADHSLESYSVRGIAYVVKPIKAEDISEALFQCREIFMRNARFIEIRADRVDLKIPLNKIYSAESRANYVIFRAVDGEYRTRMTLDEAQGRLGGKPFYRCHQSFIVNTNYVDKVGASDIILKNGESAPMRKNGRDAIRADLAEILSGRMFEVF